MSAKTTESRTKLLLICGPAGALFFVVVFLIEGPLRKDYDAMRYPVSSLSLETGGWVQVLNFLVTGSLILAYSFGIRTQHRTLNNYRKIANLVLFVGLGLAGAGIFSTDPVFGYPEYLPMHVAQFTFTGHMHDLLSLLVFICLPWACFVSAKGFAISRHGYLASYSRASAVFIILTFLLAGIGFKQTPVLVQIAGSLQRFSIIGGCAWMAVLGIYLLNKKTVS